MALAAATVTISMALESSARIAWRAPELRVAFEAAQTMIAATAAYVVYGRVRRLRHLNDLAVVFGLALLGAGNLFYTALAAIRESDEIVFLAWAPATTRLAAVMCFAWAALAPDRFIPGSWRRPGLLTVAAADILLVAIAVAAAAATPWLPAGITVVPNGSSLVDLDAHMALSGILLATCAAATAAAVGFVRRTEQRPDPLTLALGIACVLLAFAYLCFTTYPSLFTDVVQTGDFLRLGFYLVLVAGAEREIARSWDRLAVAGVAEERRRLARELHDGVAQELAFVVGQTRLLTRGTAPPGTDERVAAAAERALDESRRAIVALSMRADEPLDLALARAAEDVAGRVGVAVRVHVPPTVTVEPRVREALVRIVQESVSNAGRHGKADRVDVSLDDAGVLRIVDDGCGFRVDEAHQGRFGLVSMRERAERLGAKFSVRSAPGSGTTIEVVLR